MADIESYEVTKFVRWIDALPNDAKSLAIFVLSGCVEPNYARAIERDNPDVFKAYDFIGVLAGGKRKDPDLLDEARLELVSDFYASLS